MDTNLYPVDTTFTQRAYLMACPQNKKASLTSQLKVGGGARFRFSPFGMGSPRGELRRQDKLRI